MIPRRQCRKRSWQDLGLFSFEPKSFLSKPESKEELARLRAFFLLNKILHHNPKSKKELEGRNGADVERHPRGAFLSEIGVLEGYESKRLHLQIVSLFFHFKRIPFVTI